MKAYNSVLSAVVVSVLGLSAALNAPQALAAESQVVFYEGDNGTQDIVCIVPFNPFGATISFKNDSYGCDNDEARSMRFVGLPSGSTVTVFDSPSCKKDDDWTQIRLNSPANNDGVLVGRFDRSDANWLFTSDYHRWNGIQGKVSCIWTWTT